MTKSSTAKNTTQSFEIKETLNEGLKRAYQVVVNASVIRGHMDRELAEVGKTAKIAGFRPGKVPTKVLEQRFGRQVMGQVLENTVQHAVQQVSVDQNVIPALTPDVKIENFPEGGDLTLAIKMEVMPDISSIAFDGIQIEQWVATPEEEAINTVLADLAKASRSLEVKKGKAALGDVVKIDFKGFLNDVPFEGGEAKEFNLELGSGQFIPGFEDQLVGKKAGDETKVNVSFPDDYHKADLAGQPVVFEVKIHEVQESKIADVDDALATRYGFDSLATLKEEAKKRLESQYSQVSRNRLKKTLFDALEPKADFPLPESMVEMEFKTIWKQYHDQLHHHGDACDGDHSEDQAEYRAIAARRVRLGILLSHIAREQKIGITNQELNAALMNEARQFPGQEAKVFEFYQKNPQYINELRGPILEDKAVDYILTQVKIVEKAVSAEALLKEDEEEATQAPAKKATKAKKESSAKKEDAEQESKVETTPKKSKKKEAGE